MTRNITEKLNGILRLAEARDFGSVNFQLNTLADQVRSVIEDMASEPADDAFNDCVEAAIERRMNEDLGAILEEHQDKLARRVVDPMIAALSTASGAICSLQEQIGQVSGMFNDSDGAIAQAIMDGDEALTAIKSVLPDSNPPTVATY